MAVANCRAMRLILRQGTELTELDIADGRWRLGGAEEDAIRLEGLPAGLVELAVDGEQLTLTATEALQINGALFPSGIARLLVAGESLALPDGTELLKPESDEARAGTHTVAVLRDLFQGDLQATQTRAATLTCLTGLDAGRVFPLEAQEELGRGDRASLRIRDRSVSRRHARLFLDGEVFFVEDLGSPNGIFVNGERCDGPRTLANGDLLELGHTLLRFNDSAEQPAPEPQPEPEPAPAVEAPSTLAEEPSLEMAPEAEPEQAAPLPADAKSTLKRALAHLARTEWAVVSVATGMAMTGLLVGWMFR